MTTHVSPEEVYAADWRSRGTSPTTPFAEISDMAIQMYETEADMLSARIVEIVKIATTLGSATVKDAYRTPHVTEAARVAAEAAARLALGVDTIEQGEQ
jgi:hypothetical protein